MFNPTFGRAKATKGFALFLRFPKGLTLAQEPSTLGGTREMHLVFSLLVLLQAASPQTPTSLPGNLVINNVQWKIAMTDWDPRGVSGLTSYSSHTIYISRKQSLRNEQDTLMHELLHCVMGHRFTDKKVIGHDIIANLTPRLLQLFKDNPELVTYLQQTSDDVVAAKQPAD